MRLFGGGGEDRFETIVSKGTVVRGNLSARGPVRIEGRVEGDIRSDDAVVVNQEAEVQGNIAGKSVTIGGRVVGRVESQERVVLLPNSQLVGDVWSPRLSLEEGALYDGQVRMGTAPQGVRAAVPSASVARLQQVRRRDMPPEGAGGA